MRKTILLLAVGMLGAISAFAAPTIDGMINAVAENWLLLTEYGNGGPIPPYPGGATDSSDLLNESAVTTWYEGNGTKHVFDNPRGDIRRLYVATDINYLYLAIAGPTVPFNNYADQGGGNDQGNLYVAIDSSLGGASGFVAATSGHTSYGQKAVDFNGWTPSYIVGLLFVDNGGGGGGGANVEQTGTHNVMAAEGQGQGNGGFDWMAQINGSNEGEFEFALPWTMIGMSGPPEPGEELRFAMYTTYDAEGWDTFDSGPGFGQVTHFEQIGDSPGDPDSAGQLGASDPGSTDAPGSNQILEYTGNPGHDDGVDTIEAYLTYTPIPEPGTIAALVLGLAGFGLMKFRGHIARVQQARRG
jgi:hypothetical protein